MKRHLFNTLIFFSSYISSNTIFYQDTKNFYKKNTIISILQVALPSFFLSNSNLDMYIDDFYQKKIRSNSTDYFSNFSKHFGSVRPMMIGYTTSIAIGCFLENSQNGTAIIDIANSTLRAVVIGFPTLIIGQIVTGADRPIDNTCSYWQPFCNNHGISGHAFVGATPFMTLAHRVENKGLKALLYTFSTFTALSRINDQSHYFSQAFFGWSLALLSCKAVNKTNLEITIHPNGGSLGGTF